MRELDATVYVQYFYYSQKIRMQTPFFWKSASLNVAKNVYNRCVFYHEFITSFSVKYIEMRLI